MSSAIVSKLRFTTPITRPDQEINEAARFCVELHRNNFCDIGRLMKFPPTKRRKIIAKAMLLELGPCDPPDDCVMNYKDNAILEIYKRLTERKLDKNNLYKQIYHQLTYT